MLFRRSKSMTPAQASAAMSAGELVLVDVREPAELAQARVRGAIHIPSASYPLESPSSTPNAPSRSCADPGDAAPRRPAPPPEPALTRSTSPAGSPPGSKPG